VPQAVHRWSIRSCVLLPWWQSRASAHREQSPQSHASSRDLSPQTGSHEATESLARSGARDGFYVPRGSARARPFGRDRHTSTGPNRTHPVTDSCTSALITRLPSARKSLGDRRSDMSRHSAAELERADVLPREELPRLEALTPVEQPHGASRERIRRW
jgi:hypothetical protein